uniref:Uncharacterized protein n=1 Tax=Globodera rostochiensis TaxID=31243 RepID=A0A914HQB2_GLORO
MLLRKLFNFYRIYEESKKVDGNYRRYGADRSRCCNLNIDVYSACLRSFCPMEYEQPGDGVLKSTSKAV